MNVGAIGGHNTRVPGKVGSSCTKFGNASAQPREEGKKKGMAAIVDTEGMVVGAESCMKRTKLTLEGLPAWFEVCGHCGQVLCIQPDSSKVGGCTAEGNGNSFLYWVEVDGINMRDNPEEAEKLTYAELVERVTRGKVHETCFATERPCIFGADEDG